MRLYEDHHFTFRFGDDRPGPRVHLGGVPPGTPVAVYRIDPATDGRLGLLAEVVAGEGGWVDLAVPLVVRAGEAFVAVPQPGQAPERGPTFGHSSGPGGPGTLG